MSNKISIDWEIHDEAAGEFSDLEDQFASNSEQTNNASRSYYSEVGYAVTAALVTGALMFVGGHRWSSDPEILEPAIEIAPNPNIGSKRVLSVQNEVVEGIPEVPFIVLKDIEDRYLGTGAIHSGEIGANSLRYSLFVHSAYLYSPLKEDLNGKIRALLTVANSNVDKSARDYMNNSSINLIYLLQDSPGCAESIFKYRTSPASPRQGFIKTVSCPYEQTVNVSMTEKDLLIGALKTYLSIVYDFNNSSEDAARIWEAVIHAGQGQTWLEYRTHIGLQNSGLGIEDYELLLSLFLRDEK